MVFFVFFEVSFEFSDVKLEKSLKQKAEQMSGFCLVHTAIISWSFLFPCYRSFR